MAAKIRHVKRFIDTRGEKPFDIGFSEQIDGAMDKSLISGDIVGAPELKPLRRMAGVVYPGDAENARYVGAGALTRETLASAYREVAQRFPSRLALCDAAWTCSHAELDAVTDRAAAAFLNLGLEPLDRVIFQMANSKELVIALLACFKAGLIPICTLAAHRRMEIEYLGNHAEARAHFVDGDNPKFDLTNFSRQIKPLIPSLGHTLAFRCQAVPTGVHSFENLLEDTAIEAARSTLSAIEPDPFQVALFQLSGGTSGIPKIIPRFNSEYLYTIRTAIECHGTDENVVAYTPNPMIHNAPIIAVWGPALFAGGTVAICSSLDPSAVGHFFRLRRPNWMLFPAPALMRLQEAGWMNRLDFSHVRGFLAGSGAAKLRAILPDVPIWPTFGMTEGLMCSTNASDPVEATRDTVGRPLSELDETHIFDPESERQLAEGETGELVVRGPSTLRGYYAAPERDAVAFTTDGFYRTGDLMAQKTIEGRQYLLFKGRAKDVIDRGGEKINCEEVERVCAAHPGIGAVSIVAMPDPVYGQRACAFVITSPDGRAPDVKELGVFLEAQGMAKFKWPERVEVLSEFPLTSSGKLSKPLMREMIEGRLHEEGVLKWGG